MQFYSPGSFIDNRYEVVSSPIKGGMGVVYFCLDHKSNQPKAIKTFRPEFLAKRDARERFLREGNVWVKFGSHPHIVRCYEVRYLDPMAFLVLELVVKENNLPDASLRAWMNPGKPLMVDQALLFSIQIARGMDHACKIIPGFVHRDLKPENVLVGADKLPGTTINRLRVTDFGLCKVITDYLAEFTVENLNQSDPKKIHFTRGVGTPLYMAPEQWLGQPVGEQTDIYSLGCILYEMVIGQTAAEGMTIYDLLNSHCKGKLRSIPKVLSEDVSEIIQRCLRLFGREPYKDWSELASTLELCYEKLSSKEAPKIYSLSELTWADRVQSGLSHNAIGISYLHIGRPKEAIAQFEQVLKIGKSEQLGALECVALDSLGVANKDLGETQRAIEYSEQALVIAREIGFRVGESKALGNLGSVYIKLGDFFKAIEYFEQQLFIAREIGDRNSEGTAMLNLGASYFELYLRKKGSHLQIAIGCFEQALTISNEVGNRRAEVSALTNLGSTNAKLGDTKQAIMYYERAIALSQKINDLDKISVIKINMAMIYGKNAEIEHARILTRQALDWLEKTNNPNAQRARQLLVELESENNPANLINTYRKAMESFLCSNSLEDMRVATVQFPLLIETSFIDSLKKTIPMHLRPEHRPMFDQRLIWLNQIIGKNIK